MALFEEITATVVDLQPGDGIFFPPSVTFGDGRRASLLRLPIAEAHHRRLSLLQSLRRPAWVRLGSIPGEGLVVLDVESPVVARVLAIRPMDGGDLVVLDRSAARHVLRFDVPGRAALRDRLVRSLGHPHEFVVVRRRPFAHDILDVLTAGEVPGFEPPAVEADDLVAIHLGNLLPTLTRMRVEQASAFAAQLRSTGSCGNPGAVESCIPFRFVEDGCFARANRMCELLEQIGIKSGKIWVWSNKMFVATADAPSCQVAWSWHAATLVRSQANEPLVLDPVVCGHAVDLETYLLMLHDPQARVEFTTAAAFLPSVTDGKYIAELPAQPTGGDETEDFLKLYRLNLEELSPPPPYPCGP